MLILLFVGNLLGLLTDQQEDAVQYYVAAGNVGIDLMVDTETEDAIEITPNAVTPLNIGVTNTGTKDCYVFIKLVIPVVFLYLLLAGADESRRKRNSKESVSRRRLKNKEKGQVEVDENRSSRNRICWA